MKRSKNGQLIVHSSKAVPHTLHYRGDSIEGYFVMLRSIQGNFGVVPAAIIKTLWELKEVFVPEKTAEQLALLPRGTLVKLTVTSSCPPSDRGLGRIVELLYDTENRI